MAKRPLLLFRVFAELGNARIQEGFIPSDPACYINGRTNRRIITVNPAPNTVDSVVHELLHRLYPEWAEVYVRNRTSYLMARLTDEECQTIYDEYQKRRKKRKTRKVG